MLLLSYVQLTTLAADTVTLRSELTALEAENVTLTAQHEQMFDMATVKEVAAAAGMAKPTSSQIAYLDIDQRGQRAVYQSESDRPSILSRISAPCIMESTPWWNISTDPAIICCDTAGSEKPASSCSLLF